MSQHRMPGYTKPDPTPVWINVIVEIERPAAAEMEKLSRGERYRCLKQNTDRHLRLLKTWIDQQGLADEVLAMGEATVFNVLFVKCTPDAAEALSNAPGVVDVKLAGESPQDLMAVTHE